jgi:hypothetical protein
MSDGRREHEEAGDGRTRTFLVEHYWPGVTAEAFARAADRVRASADRLAGEGRRIRYLHSTLVPEDEAAFCVFEAESQQLVEEAYARAEVTFERVRAAVETVSGSREPERST